MRKFGSNEKICNSVVTLFKIFSLSSAIPNVQLSDWKLDLRGPNQYNGKYGINAMEY